MTVKRYSRYEQEQIFIKYGFGVNTSQILTAVTNTVKFYQLKDLIRAIHEILKGKE